MLKNPISNTFSNAHISRMKDSPLSECWNYYLTSPTHEQRRSDLPVTLWRQYFNRYHKYLSFEFCYWLHNITEKKKTKNYKHRRSFHFVIINTHTSRWFIFLVHNTVLIFYIFFRFSISIYSLFVITFSFYHTSSIFLVLYYMLVSCGYVCKSLMT